MSAMDEKLVDAAIKRYSVKGIGKGMTIANKAGLLQIQIRKDTKPEDFMECDKCHAGSDINDSGCPFCGEGDDPAAAAPEAPKEQTLVKVPKKAKQTKPSTQVVKAVEPKTEPADSSAVTVNEKELIEGLDKAVRDIVALNAGMEASKWLLGRKIQELYEGAAWMLRRDEEGHDIYRSFQQFSVAELGIDGSTALRLMDISKEFTEEQVKALGTHRLRSLIRIGDREVRGKLIGRIEKEGLSTREVEAEVKRLNPPRRDTGRKETPVGGPGKRALPEGSVAAALKLGAKNVQLYTKDSPTKKAKTVEDVPWGVLELDNDVEIHFTLMQGSAGLVLKVDVKKEDPLAGE